MFRDSIPAFSDATSYADYKEIVKGDHPYAQHILVGGSGNWGYSFNPTKLFRPFSNSSDIDLVVVSMHDFNTAWENIRNYHRRNWYRIGYKNQQSLRRNGENVYSGFVTEKWIPEHNVASRIRYQELADKYSNQFVGYREVNIMYFKNKMELIDYYTRSFKIVRRT